jgi:hypothetical protein
MTSPRCLYCAKPAAFSHARHDSGVIEDLCADCYHSRWHPPLVKIEPKVARRRGRPTRAESKPTIFPISLNVVQRDRLDLIALGDGQSPRQWASNAVIKAINARWRICAGSGTLYRHVKLNQEVAPHA